MISKQLKMGTSIYILYDFKSTKNGYQDIYTVYDFKLTKNGYQYRYCKGFSVEAANIRNSLHLY